MGSRRKPDPASLGCEYARREYPLGAPWKDTSVSGLWTPSGGDPVPGSGGAGGAPPDEPPEPTASPEEVAAMRELHARLVATPVLDVIVNHALGIWQLGLVHLGVVTPPRKTGRNGRRTSHPQDWRSTRWRRSSTASAPGSAIPSPCCARRSPSRSRSTSRSPTSSRLPPEPRRPGKLGSFSSSIVTDNLAAARFPQTGDVPSRGRVQTLVGPADRSPH